MQITSSLVDSEGLIFNGYISGVTVLLLYEFFFELNFFSQIWF